MAVDLTFARLQVAALLLVDDCTITHTRNLDEPLDPTTGVRPSSTTTVYDGKFAIKPRANELESVASTAGRVDPDSTYIVSLPWDAPAVPWGAVLTVTAAKHDTQLVGRRFEVRRVVHTTLLVTRKITARELPEA